MKIGVDLRPLRWKLQAGIPRVVYNIFKELILYESELYMPMGFSQNNPCWSDQLLSDFGKNHKIDVFLSLFDPLPIDRQFPGVLFIHDLIPVRFQELCNPAMIQLFYRIRHSAESCQHIITNSQASKQDIIQLWDIDDQKIAVVPLGISDDLKDIVVNYEEKWQHKANAMLQRFNIYYLFAR